MFVRGNMLSVLDADAHSVSNKGLLPGDTVRVSGRKKGGWLRVRSSRTGAMISIRSGHHLCLASKAARPVSQIDLLIREKQLASSETQVQKLENRVGELQDECATFKQQWSDREKYVEYLEAELAETGQNLVSLEQEFSEHKGWWEEAEEVQIDNKSEIESLEKQLDIARQLLDEATKQNAELLEERSILQEKLKKSEAEFAEWRADMGWVEMPPGFVPTDEETTTAANGLMMLSNGVNGC